MDIFGTELADDIVGSLGNDNIFARLGNDTIFGDEGEDSIFGEGGNDSISGGEDSDTLNGDEGEDTLNGNEGDDSLSSGSGNDILNGNEGNDTLFGREDDDTLFGGSGNDSLNGNEGNDILNGNEGNDTLNSDDGDDTLSGGSGNDSLSAGSGNNSLDGNEGDDTLFGRGGLDTLFGGSGNDSLNGNEGNDILNGNEGSDTLNSNEGDDTLFGGSDNDSLNGDEGNDILNGNEGNDTLFGREDDDTLFGNEGNDTLYGNEGDDRLIGVDASPDSNDNFGRDTIDVLTGGPDNDTFVLAQRIEDDNVVFYDSGSNGLGTEDYALINNFDTNEDILELIGSRDDYSFAASPADLPSGVGVFSEQESGQELIAILEGISESNIEEIKTTLDPTIRFDNILQTPTLIPDEQGRLEFLITNPENLSNATITLFASTDRVLDEINEDEGTVIEELEGIDEELGTMNVDLTAGENTFIDFASADFDNPSVVSPGGYHLIVEVDFGNGNSDLATQFVSSDNTDVVLDWNSTFLNAVQAEGKAEQDEELPQGATNIDEIPGVAPPIVARNGAILHQAIYEAVNALSGNSGGSSLNLNAPNGASQEAAAVGAAYTVLSELFVEEAGGLPGGFLIEQQTAFDLQRDRSLAEISDTSAAENDGFNFGVNVANTILQQRAGDGTEQAQVPYQEDAEGLYREFTERGQVTALLPDFGRVDPFAIDNIEDFRPENLTDEKDIIGLQPFGTQGYVNEIEGNEDIRGVRVNGALENTSETIIERTDDETETAQFFSYDRVETFRPPGQWNEIAQEAVLSEDDLNSIEENALLFAQLNIAMADAGIVTWDVKFTEGEELLRPVTSIRQIGPNEDDRITEDDAWEPLIPTPIFADYISGHSAFGGAAATVLENFFDNDLQLEIPTQELPGTTRTFTGSETSSSFMEIADEYADSRLFGGVHIDSSNQDGVAVGMAVAENILSEGNIFA